MYARLTAAAKVLSPGSLDRVQDSRESRPHVYDIYIYIYIFFLFFDPEGLPYKFLVFLLRKWTGDPPETLSIYIYIYTHIYTYMYICVCMYKYKYIYIYTHMYKLHMILDLCVSSLRRGHANLLCIVPILTDDPRRESTSSCI